VAGTDLGVQADALTGALADSGRELTAAILIDVPDEMVVRWISGRHQGRSDDRPETVRERLRVYHRDTEPLITLLPRLRAVAARRRRA
jgi:adenylate kinase